MKSTKDERVPLTSQKPRQKISEAEKRANNFAWAKDTMAYYSGNGNGFGWQVFNQGETSPDSEIVEKYQWYNNHIPEKYFHYVQNPLNTTKEDHKNFPAKIRPYTIIRPSIDRLCGEYRSRPFSYNVNVNNPDAINKMQEKEFDLLKEQIEAMWLNAVKGALEDKELKGKIIENQNTDPNAIVQEDLDKFQHSYKDERAIQGQYAIDYLIRSIFVVPTLCNMFKDWLIAGTACSLKYVHREEIIYERVNPRYLKCDESVEYSEDGEWATHITYVSLSQLVDMFYDELSEADIDDLDKNYYGGNFKNSYNTIGISANQDTNDTGLIPLVHTTWKTFKKIGLLTYTDEFGEMQKMQVPEEYKVKKELGETVEWLWVDEVWEGYCANNKYYLRIGPIPAQRNQMNNLSSCKLPYNKRRYSDANDKNISIMDLCIPYQILYIIVIYMMELTLGKTGGKVLLIDKNVIPNKGGWDFDKFMYYGKALGYAYIDRNQPGADKTFNQYQVLDMSTLKDVMELVNMAEYVKKMLASMLGFTPQREGEVKDRATVGATDASIFMSSIVSEEIFARFDEFVQRELTGLLDLSKLAWREGKKAMFIGSDMRTKILEIDPVNYVNTDFGLTISNSTKDKETLDGMKSMAQALSQNGSAPSTVLEVLKSQNISGLSAILQEIEKKQQTMAANQQQEETKLEQDKLNVMMMLEKVKGELRINEINTEYDRKEKLALLEGDILITSTGNEDVNGNGVLDVNEIEKRNIEREKMSNDGRLKVLELGLKQQEIENKRQESLVKASTEVYKADKSLEIAKQNKNKYDG